MKLYHIILGLFIITSSCTSDDTIENSELNQQDLTTEKIANNLVRTNGEVSETLHASLQYFSYFTADAIHTSTVIEQEIRAYLQTSQENTISTTIIFSKNSPVPELKKKIISFLNFCGEPERPYHRPGRQPDDEGDYSINDLWHCFDLYSKTVFYEHLVRENETELYFPDGLDALEGWSPNSRIITSTSFPNISLLRENEGYRFFPDNELAADYFAMEYEGEGVEFHGHNPMRINTANDYVIPNESVVIARIKMNDNKQ